MISYLSRIALHVTVIDFLGDAKLAETASHKNRRSEITIALIGLLGVFATAVLSNWDKVFPKENIVEATYSGYRPTGKLETEVRYLFEVTGQRRMMEMVQQEVLSSAKMQMVSRYPQKVEEIEAILAEAFAEHGDIDDIINLVVPIYKNYYSLEEIQTLNKFFSTEVMQNMIAKDHLVVSEMSRIQMEISQQLARDYFPRILKILAEKE